MNIRAKLLALQTALETADDAVCGSTPRWVRELLLSRLRIVFIAADGESFAAEAEAFVLGALRFLADSNDNRCECLLTYIAALESDADSNR